MVGIAFKFSIVCLASMMLFSACEQNVPAVNVANTTKASTNDSIPVYNFEELAPFLQTNEEQTIVVNFWAMWCVPCVNELPYFQALADQHPEIKVILVSLDFPSEITTKLKPFLKQKAIDLEVVILDDPDANTWINKIDPNWSGAIPFTIVFNNNKRAYFEQSFESVEDLENQTINN